MAEKKYKNYDERFLKEDSSSSGPVAIQAVFSSDDNTLLISEWPDGTPIKTVEDLYSVFKSGATIAFTRQFGGEPRKIEASPTYIQKFTMDDQSVAMIVIDVGDIVGVTTEELYDIMASNHP